MNQPGIPAGLAGLLPARKWIQNSALRSWPIVLFVALVAVPPAGLVIIGPNPTAASFSDASWLFAAYFAIAWLLLIGVLVRPAQVTKQMLLLVVVVALVTQIPLAVALEDFLHSSSSNLLSSIFTIGLPEEVAKAIPVVVVAVMFRNRLSPVDYLFLGAVSGLVFGASEVVHYLTSGAGIGQEGAGILILSYVWRFVTDPIVHACWAGLTGYFVGLAVSGRYRWQQVAGIGLAMAMILHGLNDWDKINGNVAWVVVVAVSGILFVAYAKDGPGVPAQSAAAQPATAQFATAQFATAQSATAQSATAQSATAQPAAAQPAATRPGASLPPAAARWPEAQPAGSRPIPVPATAPAPAAAGGVQREWWQSFVASPPTVTMATPGGPSPAPRNKPWWEE